MIYKNILVTGGCGFIASNFINMMAKKYKNTNWINLDAMYYCADIDNIDKDVQNFKNYHFIKGNTNSVDLVNHILEKYQIDAVINFAAQSHVCNSFGESLLYTKDNIMGTHTLLECCRKYGIEKIKKFIHVSTDEVYGESELNEDSKNECSILYPTNPYAATKAGAEMLVISYYKSFKLPIIITRGNNVYGPRQYPEKLIPKFITSLLNNQKCTIHGNGNQLRSFLYVDDTINAFDIILNNGKIGEIYNIGSDEEYTVIKVTELLISILKPSSNINDWLEFIKDRDFNDLRYNISTNKLKELGWTKQTNFNQGISQTITYYQQKHNRESI